VLETLDDHIDYTDSISRPSTWATPELLRQVACEACLDEEQTASFLADPDAFMQEPVFPDDELIWYEHPLFEQALDRAWKAFVSGEVETQVRTAALLDVFGDSIMRKAA
jgi:hypothetical protein